MKHLIGWVAAATGALAVVACSSGDSGTTGGGGASTAGGGNHHAGSTTTASAEGGSTPTSTSTSSASATSTSTSSAQGGSGATSTSSTGSGPLNCPIFPADNPWNTPVDTQPVDPNSDNYVQFINDNGGDGPLHADFDGCCGDGIPFAIVDNSVTKVAVAFDYSDESDPGPYPIPANNPPIENGGDHHIILVDKDECKLYEMWNSRMEGGGWAAGSGAIFDLTSNALRPDCWTSADAAGLAIYPGLVRFAEVTAGEIAHALRFTVDTSQSAWISPARHQSSSNTDPNAPPMGLHFRLKTNAHVDAILAGAGPQPKVVLTALRKYGMIVADNGSNWYVSGEPNAAWDDDSFHQSFDQITGDDFEVVQITAPIEHDNNQTCP